MKKWIVTGVLLLAALLAVLVLLPEPEPQSYGTAVPQAVAPGQGGSAGAAGSPHVSAPAGGSSPAAIVPATGAPAGPAQAPWMTGLAGTGGAAARAPGTAAADKDVAELQAMQAELLRQTQQGREPDPKLVDATLAKAQEVEGSSVVSGINIPAVRQNLAKAQQLRELAQAMEKEANRPGGPDMTRLKAQLAQLQNLQSHLRRDVSVSEPKAAAPAAAGTVK